MTLADRLRSNEFLRRLYRLLAVVRVRARLLLHRGASVPGLLTVIVVGGGEEAVRSLRDQRSLAIDVRVATDATDADRLVGESRAEFIAFLEPADVARPAAYVMAITALGSSGSDFALLSYEYVWLRRKRPAEPAVQRLHAEQRLACTPMSCPEAQVNTTSAAKVYRRSFWSSAGLTWTEPLELSANVFARSETFDVIPAIGVTRLRAPAIIDPAELSAALCGRVDAGARALRIVSATGGDTTARAAQLLNVDLRPFLLAVPRGDLDYWAELRTAVADLRDRLGPDDFATHIEASSKVMTALIAADRRDELIAFLEARGDDVNRFRTRISDQTVLAELPGGETRLADAEVTADAARLGATWNGDRLDLTGWAFISFLDLAALDTSIAIEAIGSDGTATPVPSEPIDVPVVDEHSRQSFADYRRGGFRATVDASTLGGPGPWTFRATIATSGVERSATIRPSPVRGAPLSPLPNGSFLLRRARSAPVELVASSTAPGSPTGPRVTAIRVEGDAVHLQVTGSGTANAMLVSPSTRLHSAGGSACSFSLSSRVNGQTLAIPGGTYRLLLGGDPVAIDPALLAEFPMDLLADSVRVRPVPTAARQPALSLAISAPLRPEERGVRNQQRLRDEHRVEHADLPAVFFRSLYGEVTNCNARAVHEELVRRGSPLSLNWSVRDRSVAVPPGGTPILEESAEWHRIIAGARYHLVNVHQLAWFSKPEGQQMIQTMHGFPYKLMGHGLWDSQRLPWTQVANFDRRAREWDFFVSPATYATPLLTEAFLTPAEARPTILEIGYPRNDSLLADSAADVRARTRRELGIGDEQIAVMYAPTFRDYLAVGDMKADYIEFFDPAAASQQLGSDYVFLMRGHPFNARSESRPGTGHRIIDVTDHPEINELCLASDAAILDYSSLRFDYALTGKPMIFLVPDVEEYDAARGGVIPFGPTAPGPHLTSTAEVIGALRDFGALRAGSIDALAAFRRDYVDLDDGHASARLVDAVFVPRGDAPVGD